MVYSFADLKLPSLIVGPIKPCRNFSVACITSKIIFKINLVFSICMLVQTIRAFAHVFCDWTLRNHFKSHTVMRQWNRTSYQIIHISAYL